MSRAHRAAVLEDIEVTSPIDREELLTLLHTSGRSDAQRITARMPAAMFDELLHTEIQPEAPPDGISITFRDPRTAEVEAPMSHFVIALSFAATFALGVVVLVLL